jgi:hypothetical protein
MISKVKYERLNFKNGSPPAINAATLNHIESGIVEASESINKLEDDVSKKVDEDNVYSIDEADEHFLSAVEPGGSVESKHIKNKAVDEDKLSDGVVKKINSKAEGDLFLKKSSTQLIKLTDVETTINGLHIAISNNHVSVKGTAESGIYSSIGIDAGISEFNANTDYTISVQNVIDNTSEADYIGIFYSGQSIPVIENDNFRNINFTETTALSLNWNIQPGTYDKEFDFKIELGTEATSFEPYYVVTNIAKNSVTENALSEEVRIKLNSTPSEKINELFGKSIYSDGDSLADGSETGGVSYAHLIANKYCMNLTSKAVGNTTLAIRKGQVSSIYGRMTNITGEYDYIIFDGGTNDVTANFKEDDTKVLIGEITTGYDAKFDSTTTLGALESICKYLNEKHCKAKKLFIFPNARVDSYFNETQKIFSKMKKVLNKWGIPFVDLSAVTSLGRWADNKDEYFVDFIHPSMKAYEDFYVPSIEKALLYGGYVGSGGSASTSSGNGSYTLTDADISTITNKVLENFIDMSEVGL